MDFIKSLIVDTPWWVYVIFIYIIIKGIKAFHTQDLPYVKTFIIPLLFLALGISSFTHYLMNGSSSLIALYWLVGLGIGILMNHFIIANPILAVNHSKKIVTIKGSPWLLIYLLTIFIVKYYFGYQLAAHPEVIHDHAMMATLLSISGVFTGIFTHKLWQYRQAIKHHSQGSPS